MPQHGQLSEGQEYKLLSLLVLMPPFIRRLDIVRHNYNTMASSRKQLIGREPTGTSTLINFSAERKVNSTSQTSLIVANVTKNSVPERRPSTVLYGYESWGYWKWTNDSLAVTLRITRFNIQEFYILFTECIYVLGMDLRRGILPYQIVVFFVYNRFGEYLLRGASLGTRVRFQESLCDIRGVFSEYYSFPCQYHSPSAPPSSSSTCCSYQRTNGRRLGTFQKALVFRKSGSIG
jgi:hypothetical protein